LNIDKVKVGQRFRKDLGSIDSLVEDIRTVGLLQPIVVDTEGTLIAGNRRLQACTLLGWKDVPATVVDLDADTALRAQMSENMERKDFTRTEMVEIKRAVESREKAKAKERMVAAHASPGNLPEQDKGRIRDKAAAIAGVSGRTLEKAEAVVEAAEADPSLAPVVEEMDRTGKVDPAYRMVRQPKSQVDLLVQIRRQAVQGYTAGEMTFGPRNHVQTDDIHRLARENKITLPPGRGKPNHARVIRVTVEQVGLYSCYLEQTEVDALDPEQAREWAKSLRESLRALNRLAKRLEAVAGNQQPDQGGTT
jgi:hypothetical protein